MDMHLAYQAACLNRFSVDTFGRLAAALAVIRAALEQNRTSNPEAIPTLDAALETLLAVRRRGDETDVWEITESERPAVLAGIDMAEECIGTLDVALLEQMAALLLQQISAG